MPSAAYNIIRQAIIDRHEIVATYNGHVREMCPHAIGFKNGQEHALLYQFAGGSSSGLGPDGDPGNWRCVFVNRLTNVSARAGAWHTAPNHSRPQRCVDQIDQEVTY